MSFVANKTSHRQICIPTSRLRKILIICTPVLTGYRHLTIHKMNRFIVVLLSSFLLSLPITKSGLQAQTTRKVLFLGNSYTYFNGLPQMVHDAALSAGDNLVFDIYAPGGYRLIDHATDGMSQSKIAAGGWHYVMLQGQSQEPITHNGEFIGGGGQLNNLVAQSNPCAVTMLYMTWGRKNGDASNCADYPVMCTYQGMDTTLRNNYLHLAAAIDGEVSPVSVVWSYLRQNHPNIELYQPDESHPSPAGSYAAACCFYTTIFKKDPTLISFNPGLNATDAAVIRNAVKIKVFNNLSAWDFVRLPTSGFTWQAGTGTNELIFAPLSQGVQQTYFWDFGDGTTSSIPQPIHSFSTNGPYTVTLTTTNCDLQGLHTSITDTVIQFCDHTPTVYTTHPWLCEHDTLWTQTADAYQWFHNGLPIPETGRYIDYSQYNLGYFSVISTVNGCSELSAPYTDTPEWSGYYFDMTPGGDPCEGDTVAFAVLYTGGPLSGSEIIKWYKNGALLPLMANEDTLFITGEGTYACKVANPTFNCPLDTTSYSINFDCSTSGVKDNIQEVFWRIFPNPASETVTVQFTDHTPKGLIEIYDANGRLAKAVQVSETTTIHIAGLADGLYIIRHKNNPRRPLKFIKR